MCYNNGMKKINKTVLCIIDGLGVNPDPFGNAVISAGMVNLNSAMTNFPSTTLKASGFEVGLSSDSDAGNSEVGHNAIGAGRTIEQGLVLLNKSINSGEIFETESWKMLSCRARGVDEYSKLRGENDKGVFVSNANGRNISGRKLNIIVLLSDGRVHSDIQHLEKILERCVNEGIRVAIHALADGRDVLPQSVARYIKRIQNYARNLMKYGKGRETGGIISIATIAGRAVSLMDRYESNVEAMQTGFEVLADGQNIKGISPEYHDVFDFIEKQYAKNPSMTDESLPPFVLNRDGLIENGDAVLLLNYRGDRAVQIVNMFERGRYISKEQFEKIDRCLFVGALRYDAELALPKHYLCPPPSIDYTLTHFLCERGVKQLTVAETVKFGHMTYFFNGNKSTKISEELEKWVEIKSDEIPNGAFNKKPEMKTKEIIGEVIRGVRTGYYEFIKCNIAAPDMVGHTGDFDAVVKSLCCVDNAIGELVETCREHGYNLILTADHGNAELMIDPVTNSRMTAHTNNRVPFVVMPFAIDGNNTLSVKSGDFGITNVAGAVAVLMGFGDDARESYYQFKSKFNTPIIALT